MLLCASAGRRDVLLSCADAEKLVEALRVASRQAELGHPSLYRAEPWQCMVESYDGLVALRFSRPAKRVPLPALVARRLADHIEFKKQQAAYRMRFVFDRS